MMWDVFISHAAEDKETFVRELARDTVEILAVILKSQASRWLEEKGEHS